MSVPSGLTFREEGFPGRSDCTISSVGNLRKMSNFTTLKELSACSDLRGGYFIGA
jgi:hypothetical protein